MRLSRVRIKNFRNFRDLLIEPFPTPAVILGLNGVGKSNLLHALRLVLDPELSSRARRLQADDIHDGAAADSNPTVTIEVDLTDFDDDADAQGTFDGSLVSRDGEPRVARLTYTFGPKVEAGTLGRALTIDDYAYDIYGGNDPTQPMRHAMDHVPLTVLHALRDAEGDFRRADRSPLTRLLRDTPPAEQSIQNTLAALKAARSQLNNDDNVKKLVADLTRRLELLAGSQLALVPSLDFAGREEDLIRSVQLLTDAAATRGIDCASTGTANVVYLALLLEHLRFRRSVTDGEDTILAVEEPEAHLHPSLQRKVFAHLLREPTPLLLTTHSPHIAAVTPLSSIVLADFRNGHTTATVVPPGVIGAADAVDLERYLNVTRAEILFAREVIFVEGAADAYLLPALAKAAGFDFDDHGIVVSSVEGTDFAPYAKLLGPQALNRPHWILTDGDAANATPTDKGTERTWLKEPGLWRAQQLAELADRTQLASRLKDGIDSITKADLPATGMRPGRSRQVVRARSARIYVGQHTLEVDIANLLSEELIATYNDFKSRPSSRAAFKTLLEPVEAGTAAADERADYIAEIEKIGKGRFSQRLAGHVAGMDLRTRLAEFYSDKSDDAFSQTELRSIPGAGTILTLLENLSQAVRGTPLLPARPRTPTPDEETGPAANSGSPA
ncbi:AAA family ATPase [Kitasatospora sp. NBC_01246]|uniref:ATP-dependent nuclease n=1 Tax=Kitasatospora sp. NBC_01246 TaxID=2903570 RepID=UPI002E37C98F|nr:AAA family ATPase [Kitasatospora sp. NBC_01246]